MASTIAACQDVWLRRILSDLGEKQDEATLILRDSTSAAAIARNPVMRARTKHIEPRHHFIRDLINKEVKLVFCLTEEQVAFVSTKALGSGRYKKLKSEVCIAGLKSRGSVEDDDSKPEEKVSTSAAKVVTE